MTASAPWAFLQERFPRPDFESGYAPPEAALPAPRGLALEYLDVVVLMAALSLAAFLALKRPSRRSFFLLTLFSLLYLGFWREGCVCPVGSIQNITLVLFDSGSVIPLTVIAFFMLPLLFALWFGRVFCSSVCPLGAAQELVMIRPFNLPAGVIHFLGLLPYVYLGVAVLAAAIGADFLICRYDPFVGFFRMGATLEMLIFGGFILALGTVVGRPYCRFLCPYGVLLKWMSSLSKYHLTTTPSACVRCRLCENSCPFGCLLKPAPERDSEPRSLRIRRLALAGVHPFSHRGGSRSRPPGSHSLIEDSSDGQSGGTRRAGAPGNGPRRD
ncbi:MAG: 4Fe-4S binding protein [Planctomycetes bacterium]|nr:4Fe-4S binding protein [Planctomycetota bacterium]